MLKRPGYEQCLLAELHINFDRVALCVQKQKYFWGGKLWTQSYFVETIGNANEEVIRNYVPDQLA